MKFNEFFNIDEDDFQQEKKAVYASKKWDKWLIGIGMALGAHGVLILEDGGGIPTILGGGGGYGLVKFLLNLINKSYWSYKKIKLMKLGILTCLILFAVIIFSMNSEYLG
jgi:hypothetical protein